MQLKFSYADKYGSIYVLPVAEDKIAPPGPPIVIVPAEKAQI